MGFRTKSRKTERGEVELLRGLIKLANQLQSSLTLDAIVHVIAMALSDTFGFREASIYLRTQDGDFAVYATVGDSPDLDRLLFDRPVPRYIWDQLFLEKHQIGSSYFVDHRRHQWTDEQLYYFPESDLGPRPSHEWHGNDHLFVPLYDKDRDLMGVLGLCDPVDRQLPTIELVKSLEVFATLAAVAIENARQYEALREASEQQKAQLALRHAILEVSGALLATLEPREVFARIAALLKEIVDYDALEVRLVDKATGELYCGYCRDGAAGAEEQFKAWRSPIDAGVSGWVVRHNEAQLVNDMLNDPRGELVPGTEWEPQASIIAPLSLAGEVIGVLALDRPGGRIFGEHELEPVTLFANLAAIAIHNARQYEDVETASSRLEEQLALSHELLGASGAILSSLELNETLEHIADKLKEIVDYDSMDVRLVDEERKALLAIYARDEHDGREAFAFPIALDEGISGWVVRNNEAQLVNDMASDPRAVHIPGTEWKEQQACIVVPLCVGDEVIGILAMDRLGGRTFQEHELEPARLFANLAAIAIHNARQYDELETTSAQLTSQLDMQHQLMSLSTLLLSSLDQREVFSRITTMLKDIVDYDAMDIRLLDEASRELVCIYSRDVNAEQNEQFRISIDEGLSGWVVRHDQPQLVNDMASDSRGVHIPGTGEDVAQASIVVPLRVLGKVTGVLTLDRLGGRVFAEEDLEPVILFANLAAIAIQNARTYEEMERQAISDGLTGIHNYRHFHESLKAEVRRAGRYGEHFCLLMMDLDHFKAVNDTIGHQKGDDVLRAVAGVLRTCSRQSDYLARYGGEEFAMILPQTALDEAKTLAERIRSSVAMLDPGHPDLHVTMSIGVSAYPESAEDSDGVLGAADAALLRAKNSGRNRVCLYTEAAADTAAELEGPLPALGRRFAAFIGLDEAQTAGLVTALAVHETGAAVKDEVQTILGTGENGVAKPDEVRQSAVEALVYGNERWDGGGYPEGRRGDEIPLVARAFAVCRRWDPAEHNGDGVARLRSRAAHELDPKMVQRFAAMLRAEMAEHN
ncbi:MAG: GAF domain-containing protein [Actinobacteria bacterium]|nr:GAF domain-containing protein [Actinomycetota bacterium]